MLATLTQRRARRMAMTEGPSPHRHWAHLCSTTLRRHAGVELLLVGAVLLSAGCDAGFVQHAAATTVFSLLASGVLAFAAAAVRTRWAPAPPPPTIATVPPATTSLAPAPPTSHALILAPAAGTVAPQSAAPQSAGPNVAAALATSPAALPAAPAVDNTNGSQMNPDIVALMRLPLSDLLLAAVCKDADGARRIFAQCSAPVEPVAPRDVARIAVRAPPAVPL